MSPTTKPKAKKKLKPTATLIIPSVKGPDGLPPTYICGNHQPSHVARSTKRMLELAAVKKCRNFIVTVGPSILPGP